MGQRMRRISHTEMKLLIRIRNSTWLLQDREKNVGKIIIVNKQAEGNKLGNIDDLKVKKIKRVTKSKKNKKLQI